MTIVRSQLGDVRKATELTRDWKLEPRAIELTIEAVRFTVSHEMAHHLLGHTQEMTEPASLPGEESLKQWLAEIGFELAPQTSQRQQAEMEADTLGMRLLLGSRTSEGAYDSSVASLGGSAVAFAAMTLVSETGGDPLPFLNNGPGGPTHPPLRDRVLNALSLTALGGADHPEGSYFDERVGRMVPRHPGGFALQIWACRTFCEALIG